MTEKQKSELVSAAAGLDPGEAILPVIKGLTSYHFNIRNNARKTLDAIQARIAASLSGSLNTPAYEQGMKTAAKVCCRLYAMFETNSSVNEQSFYFKILLNTMGKGSFYAFKALNLQYISLFAAEKIVLTLPETIRLEFVDKFLQASPGTRLAYGAAFKRILHTVKSRKPVISYYAGLFDAKRWADPFLHNLDFPLRDPDQILINEIQSSSPEVRILGLKALAMVSPNLKTDILLDVLATEPDESVRIIIFQIIESAPFGHHSRTFYPVLETMETISRKERLYAARAMIVSGKLPIYTVLGILRDNYPALFVNILEGLSSLDRLSFFVIQDIALNKDQYTLKNVDINLACIFGLIKKRPERVVRILKVFDKDPDDGVRIPVTQFIETTRHLLNKEKQSISVEFDDIVALVEHQEKKSKGLISSLFSNTPHKKISRMVANSDDTAFDFTDETVSNAEFNDISYRAAMICFNRSIVVNCDFSNSVMSNAYFKKCVFYNVNMKKARFETVNFDGAVFINVNAKGTVFERCSFQQASLFNCNFSGTSARSADFTEATISKCAFKRADMSGSSFAHASISAVSFLNTHIDDADFSNIKARFSRFPNRLRTSPADTGADYNNRRYQLTSTDIPDLNTACIEKINMLLFCEFIHYGEKKFFRQNQTSLLTAFDIFKPVQAHLFHLIPYLLHTNVPLPGMDQEADKQTPAGIYDYTPERETRQIISEYIQRKPGLDLETPPPWIEGLFTIGSIGSLAQTIDSDIDYWVCINESRFSSYQRQLLEKKLGNIEKFAQKRFNTQVTFFIVDIIKAKNNDFGGSTLESSGSAQARLLKEEFYRTMIHVAGKLPLWAVLPTAVSLNYYNKIIHSISDGHQTGRYVDLGDIHAISTSEYFGASIWQMFKWLKSPFKSVIKMALLEKYIHDYGKKPLLCNIYKDQWMNSGINLNIARNDAYYMLLNHLIQYYQSIDNHESVSILLTCFFLKLGISNDAQIDNTIFGLRKFLLEKALKQWDWKKEIVFEIGSFKTWQYSEIARLSRTIESYMIKKYKTVNNAFEKMSGNDSQISPKDRTMIGRKVFIEFSKQPDKVEKVLLISRSGRHFSGLHLKYTKRKDALAGTWELINKSAKSYHRQEESLIQAKTIEEIGAWLINNGLYNDASIINLVPNPTYVTYDDIRKLFTALDEFFGPVLKQTLGFDGLLLKNKINHLFISINFYAPRQQHQVTEYTAVYLNSWGEMFCKSVYSAKGFPNMDHVKKDLLTRLHIKTFPAHTVFYFSKGAAR